MVPVDLPEGWLPGNEAEELARLAAGKTVLELGAWKGRSTVVLARVARYVVSVDRHQGIEPAHSYDSLPEYFENVRPLPNVAIVVASFNGFVPLLGDRFDLVFIDGDHDAASVARDTALALDLRPDVIAYHDWDFAEVRDTVEEIMGRACTRLEGSLASYEMAYVTAVG